MMSNEPPQGAQPQHSGNPGGMREAAQALIDRYYSSTLWVDMIDEARALRTALAAPEGPAPSPLRVDDEGRLFIGQVWAGYIQPNDDGFYVWFPEHKPGYIPGSMLSHIAGLLERMNASWAAQIDAEVGSSATPEAPPPVEARQPQTGEPWDSIKYLLDSYPGAVRCRYKGLDEDLLASLSVTFIGLRDAAPRAALAAPAGAIQPHLDHQVGAQVTLSDAASAAVCDIVAERRRQVEKEGWTPQHDDEHDNGSMAKAAACYALGRDGVSGGMYPNDRFVSIWPWGTEWWKPRDPRSNLVRAGALIIAEVERLDRQRGGAS